MFRQIAANSFLLMSLALASIPVASADEADGAEGYVVGSSSFSGRYPEGEKIARIGGKPNFRCHYYSPRYKKVESNQDKKKGVLKIIPRGGIAWDEDDDHDYMLDDGLGFVFALELPVGDYYLHQYNAKCGNATFFTPEDFRIEFSVRPGTATYIGEIRYKHQFTKNMFGAMKPDGVEMTFLNAEERDMAVIRAKYPAVAELPLYTDILDWNGVAMNEFAERYATAWSSQDPVAFSKLYAEGGSLKVNDSEPAVGRSAVEAKARAFMEAFPDMTVRLVELVDKGESVQFHWHWTGTNTGPGGTGARVDLRGYEEWTFNEEGLIIQSLGHYDEEEYERQLNATTGAQTAGS